jgi:hypothetical protein
MRESRDTNVTKSVSIHRDGIMLDEPNTITNPVRRFRFFQSTDWAAFGSGFILSLAVYLMTLAPNVTLGYSGVYSTAAMYPGPSIPPGHPLWAIYGWLFIKLIPVSNIAWRLNLASAVAAALSCGLIALLVSRVGVVVVGHDPTFNGFTPEQQKSVRLVCGCVAGLGLGLDGCFWCKAVIADTWPLSVCLFAVTLCLLTRWFFAPQQTGFLYGAVFVLGLTLSESQALIPAAFGLPFGVAIGNRRLGRELFFGISIVLWCILLFRKHLSPFQWSVNSADARILVALASIATLMCAVQTFRTRQFFSEWKAGGRCAILFLGGLSAYFLLPVFSMTNPPMNWGYPRSVEGFFHLLNRGQFESLTPPADFKRLFAQWGMYAGVTAKEFGVSYLLAATVPFVLAHQLSSRTRLWMFGLLAVWFVVTTLMLAGLNMDRDSVPFVKPYFAASHLILAIFSGCGLVLIVEAGARAIGRSSLNPPNTQR